MRIVRGMAERRLVVTEPRLLTLADVAEALGASESWVRNLIRSGELRAIRIGGRGVLRVDRGALTRYQSRLTLDDDLLRVTDAARELGVARQTIINYIHSGRLRALRAGNRWLVSAADVAALAGDHRHITRVVEMLPEDSAQARRKAMLRLRTEQGLTQEQLAEKVGVKASFISRLETGARKGDAGLWRRIFESLAAPDASGSSSSAF